MKAISEIIPAELRQDHPDRVYPMIMDDNDIQAALTRAYIAKNEKRLWLAKQNVFAVADFINVPLTDLEREETLILANKRKHWKQDEDRLREEKRIREERELTQLVSEWNAGGFLKMLRYRTRLKGKALIEDEFRMPLIKAICFRLSNDPRFETELGYSFKKGLIIRGLPGIGKSFPIQMLADNPINRIQIITMAEITQSVIDEGEFRKINFGDHQIVYFDDVGTEWDGIEKIKHYGSEINWFKTYIEEFYAKYTGAFHRLMFTTNDSFDVLQDKYGYRVRSRLAEMFNLIDVHGNDLRRG